jgi:hypothetical protein
VRRIWKAKIYILIIVLSASLTFIILYYIAIMQYMDDVERGAKTPIRDIDLIPANENYSGLRIGQNLLPGADSANLTGMAGG